MMTALKVVEARIASETPPLFDIKSLPTSLDVDSLGTKLKFELTNAGVSSDVYTYRCDTVFHKIPLVCYFIVQPAGSRRASSIFTTASIVRRDTGASQRASSHPYRNKFKTKLEVLEQLGSNLNALFKNLLKYELEHDKTVIVKASKIAAKLGYDVFGAVSAYEPAIELGYRDMLVVIRGRNLKTESRPVQMLWTIYRLNPKKPIKQDSKRYDRIAGVTYQPERSVFEREFEHYAVAAKKAVDELLDEARTTARVAGEHRNHSLENFPKQLKLRGVVYSLTNASDLMTKHYNSKDGDSLAFRWYMSHETYETYSVVTRTKSEEGHLVNRTFDVNLNRGDWTRDQLERWLEAGMTTYASRAHARVATDSPLVSMSDPSPMLEAFGHRLHLFKHEQLTGSLRNNITQKYGLAYALSASSDTGIVFHHAGSTGETLARTVFDHSTQRTYLLFKASRSRKATNLRNGVTRSELEKELDSRVVGNARARITDALNNDAARIAGMTTYASRAHARVAADASLATFDDPPKQLNVFGCSLKLLDKISLSSALESYLSEGALVYGLSTHAGCGLVFWRDNRDDKRTYMRVVFNDMSSHVYAMRSNLDAGVSRKALENEIEQRVVGLNLAKISKALNAEA